VGWGEGSIQTRILVALFLEILTVSNFPTLVNKLPAWDYSVGKPQLVLKALLSQQSVYITDVVF
jgi:hypothetical protein